MPYVGGDPINFIDRWGLDEESPEDDPSYCDENPTDPGCLGIFRLAGSPQQPGTRPKQLVDTELNGQGRNLLNQRLKGFSRSNCEKVLENVIEDYSFGGLKSAENQTNFYNARNAPDSGYTQNQVVANGINTALNGTLPYGVHARTISSALGQQCSSVVTFSRIQTHRFSRTRYFTSSCTPTQAGTMLISLITSRRTVYNTFTLERLT